MTVSYDTSNGRSVTPHPASTSFTAVPVTDRHLIAARLTWSPYQIHAAYSYRPSTLVLSWNARYISLPFAVLCARIRRTPVLLWGHGYSPQDTSLGRRYRNLLALLADGVILYSGYPLRTFPNRLAKKATVVGNALFRDRPPHLLPRTTPISPDHSIRVVHVGRLRPDRGLEVVIAALYEIRRRGYSPTFTIIGEGPHRSTLEATAAGCGLSEVVRFVEPTTDDRELREHLTYTSVATFGTHGGLGVYDALEHGIPVVLAGPRHRQPPESEIVYDCFPDLVDYSNTPLGLADAIERAATDSTIDDRVNDAACAIRRQKQEVVECFANVIRQFHP